MNCSYGTGFCPRLHRGQTDEAITPLSSSLPACRQAGGKGKGEGDEISLKFIV